MSNDDFLTDFFDDYYTDETQRQAEENEFCKRHIQVVEKAKKIAMDEIRYPQFKDAYDYVDSLFKGANIKEVVAYKLSASQMEKLGFGSAEGFYDILTTSVIIGGRKGFSGGGNKVVTNIERDEVLVHELLHYAFVAEGKLTQSREIAEDFAYGWSIGYMRKKGYSDSDIIKKYCLPFFVSTSWGEAFDSFLVSRNISSIDYDRMSTYEQKELKRSSYSKVLDKAIEIGTKKAQEMIEIYNRKLEMGTNCSTQVTGKLSRFNFMDFDE